MAFHQSTCPFCSCGCGLLLEEDRGRLVASYPSAGPPGRGSLCIRGWNCTSSWSHPDRLTAPLVRGPSGLLRSTWREAVEEIAGRLETASAPALFAIGPCVANEDALAFRLLAEMLGGRTATSDLTGAPVARQALLQALGRGYGLSEADAVAGADLVWVFGADAADCPQLDSRVVAARRRGAAVVRFDVHASSRDGSRQVTLRPDSFGDIARLLQRAAFEADLVVPDAREMDGFDRLADYWRGVIGTGGGEWVGGEAAVALARELRTARRPVVVVGNRWLCSNNGVAHTVALLNALALLGARDRVVFATGEANSWGVLDLLGPEAPLAEVACREAGLDTVIMVADDLVRRSPRPASLVQALSHLRTVVVIDRFAADCLPLAHVVLPSCTFAESEGTVTNLFGDVQRWCRAVAPPGDCQPERVWVSRIASLFGANDERLLVGGTEARARFASDPVTGRSPAGSQLAIPEPEAARCQPEDDRFKLRLVIGSTASNWSTGTVSQRDEILRRELTESFLAASPSTLKEAGVKPGWPVRLLVPEGEATVTARSDPRLPAGVLVLVPLAGSPIAALRGCHVDSTGRGVAVQPVPARIERA